MGSRVVRGGEGGAGAPPDPPRGGGAGAPPDPPLDPPLAP
jgi:hypothetical protein